MTTRRHLLAGAATAFGVAAVGLEPRVDSPAEPAKAVGVQSVAWAPVVRRVGITTES